MKVLVVDDEAPIRRFLTASLTAHGNEVRQAEDGNSAIREFTTWNPDAMILDLGLPDQDGLDVLRTIREFSETPVIVLSARHHESQKISALDVGANDYVTKPFGMGELLARLRRLFRDFSEAESAGEDGSLKVGTLSINMAQRSVELAGQPIRLTKKEFDILAFMVRHPGKVLQHSQILEECWGAAYRDQTHYLRVYIKNLRAKLKDDSDDPRIIVTEPGVGYRIVPDAGLI
ncbi:response regulator transcription factor [Hwanghaeella grinnelliae]|uniref:Response regulator transcription factor n=1 Tax=Hwanghaeella grinnelliae TaxID=2500179 RepID=A0A437QWT9_9PROT|nr:response regulator transcription factor [Hwanghaeella grinnelliae]RVU39000.1 response regulator transcription factor [Hwanghaeella grinnelliae]